MTQTCHDCEHLRREPHGEKDRESILPRCNLARHAWETRRVVLHPSTISRCVEFFQPKNED